MNHLAHFHLSGDSHMVILGNLISDSIKGKDWQHYPPELAKGLLLHREIDYFTDTHPLMRQIIARNRPFTSRYAGPCTDILCDYLLIDMWADVSDWELTAYIDYIYEILADKIDRVPAPWPKRLRVLIKEDWLNHYRSRAGMEVIFSGFQKRLRRPIDVDALFIDFFEKNYAANKADFKVFYSELQAKTASILMQ